MKNSIHEILACLLLMLGSFMETTPSAGAQRREAPIERPRRLWKKVPHKVLAFYYGWYGSPQVSGHWNHWSGVDKKKQTIGSGTHYPRLGPYDSHDPKILQQHCQWAKKARIDAFIVSWWKPGDFHDKGMPLLLETAQKVGLEISAYVETAPTGSREQALEYVLYLLKQYGNHPAWLKLDTKPVLFVYSRLIGEIGLDNWSWVIEQASRQSPLGAVFIGDRLSSRAAEIFDGIHTYNITAQTAGRSPESIREWAHSKFSQTVALAPDRIVCLTVIPGYDDSKLGRPQPRPITDRHKGQTYRILWQEAIDANPDWVLITSWNEWHEGSEIEPSVENGDRALKATAEFARKFKARPPRSVSPVAK